MSLITVRTPAESRDLTLLATVKESLSVTGTGSDAQLQRLITAASEMVDDFTDRVMGRELITEKLGVDLGELKSGGTTQLMLTRIPVLMISAIRFDTDPLDMTTVELADAEAGFLFRREGFAETAIERLGIEVARTRVLEPLWEVDYSAGYILPSFVAISKPFAATDVDTSADTIGIVAHGLLDGDTARFSSTGTLPAVLTAGRDHFVRDAVADTFKVADRRGGAALDFADGGSGTHTVTRQRTLPRSLEHDAVQLVVALFRQEGADQRIKSERLGDHQVTFADVGPSGGGIPSPIAARLERFRNLV